MKQLLLIFMFLSSVLFTAVAQDRTITGTVLSGEDESPLPGVNVVVKGTNIGSITDIDGNFSVSVPSSANTLVFSYIGFIGQEAEIGSKSVVNVTLTPDATELSEVVVTAMGITQEKASLGYGVSSIDSKSLKARTQKDVAKLLRGKATGVDIAQTSGLAGSGTNIIIRGYSSITGSNQPLFVVDGIPFNTNTNNNGSFASGGGTASSRFLDLDPQTIEDISILKGLSATVLYGEAGRNGVILVTTKNGAQSNSQKGFEVSFTQQVSATQVANIPDYQDTYGNGFSGDFGWYYSTWGPSFDTRGSNGIDENGQVRHPYDQSRYNDAFPEYAGVRYDYKPYESVEKFFDNMGISTNTSVSISKNLGNGSSLSATYSYLDDQGFLPDLDEKRGGGSSNYQKKHNFGIGGQTKLDNGITLKGNFNFVNSEIRKPLTNPAFGGAGDGLFAAVLFTPRSIDMMNLEYENPLDGSNVYYRTDGGIEHPLWNLNNKADLENVQRFFSNVELGYEFTDWLKFQYRISLDSYSQFNERKVNRGSGRSDNDGYYNTIIAKSNWTDHVANLLYDKRFEKFSFNGIVGVNYRVRKFERSYLYSSNQLVYNIFAHDKFVSQTGASEIEDVYTLGVYATATVGYSDFLYLTVQGRNDWTSTLESANRSILYPSASLSFLPFEAIPGLRDNGVVDYAKFRVSYGTSAGYPDPYRTRSVLGAATNQFIGPDGTQLNTNSVSSRLGNADLAPELHSELEFGTEAQFFNGRVGLDLSLYSKTSKDLIIDLPLDPATGYTVTTVNGAEVSNKGIELGMNFTPIKTSSGFEWNMNLNYTKNVSKVESIISGVDQVIIAGYTTLGNVARPGEAYGAMLGTDFNRYETGELLVNAQGSYTVNSENVIIGNPNPDFQANMSNTFTYKGFSFGFQWNYIHGGDIYSSTVGALMARGNTVDSDFNRFQPILLNGVLSDGTPNNIQTYAGDTFFDAYFGADKGSVFDATVLRLREISLAYALPKGVLSKTPFGSASITLAGENLFYTAPNFPKGMNYDPEVLSLGVGNGRGFDFRTAPTAKRYGVTLNVTF